MRIYRNFKEALNETHRDLAEMGIPVHPHTMQDKVVKDDPGFETLELQNYGYTVTDAVSSIDQLNPVQPWADAEFMERIGYTPYENPGEAWKLRPEIWTEFLRGGKFAYSYHDRMRVEAGLSKYDSLLKIVNELKKNPDSRQCYLSIWDKSDIQFIGSGSVRVPCSLGYLFQIRRGRLNMTYYMRSCDFATHFQNDIYLAVRLMEYVALQVGVQPGDFTQFMNSLHIYKKDCEGVF